MRHRGFFAKVFRADPYPIVFKMAVPWEETGDSVQARRPVEEQVKVEWTTTQRLCSLTDSVPAPLGHSEAARTIVWEELRGVWGIRLVRWSRALDPKGSAGVEALFEAGAWLRRVHNASVQGSETVEVRRIVEQIRETVRRAGLVGAPYGVAALSFLEAVRGIGDTLVAPRALSHGDFTLANLLWNQGSHRLHVIDFENFAERSVCHDLLTMVLDLRTQLLNPVVKGLLPSALEASFWKGYGPVADEMRVFIGAVASSRIFYDFLPHMRARRQRRGRLPGASTVIYKRLFEPSMISRYCRSVM